MSKHSQSGYTLIEITIAMAISSMLAAMALMGFTALRSQAQFSNSVEQTTQTVLAKRQEALATVMLSGGGLTCVVPSDQCNISFGRILTFTPGSGVVTTESLVTLGNPAPPAAQAVTLAAASETSTYTLPWGVTYTGSSRGNRIIQVAFVRSAVDGTLQTAVSPDNGWAGRPTGSYQYGDFAPGGGSVQINVLDPTGRRAYLTVNPVNNSVTRTYQ